MDRTVTPRKEFEKKITLSDLPYATMLNPRNAIRTITCNKPERQDHLTYMGVLKPKAGMPTTQPQAV
jgi:uncharacterized protein (DUF39 family)